MEYKPNQIIIISIN